MASGHGHCDSCLCQLMFGAIVLGASTPSLAMRLWSLCVGFGVAVSSNAAAMLAM